jgi:transglutaminase-like putative cysteine protease
MHLKAGCDMILHAEAASAVVAMLRPCSGDAQWIQSESYLLEPRVPATEYVDVYGNLCQRLVIPRGEMRLKVETVVETADQIATAPQAPLTPVHDLPSSALLYLLPSRYCPSDTLGEVAQKVVRDKAPGYAQVEAIRSFIHSQLEYRYGVSNASTDARETLQAGAGVCRDFAHVGMSLCRSLLIPARMVVGYLHELDPMDMHAWFEAFLDGRWYTFDATQAEPRGGRIVMAYGRDAADVALISEYGPVKTKKMKVWVERIA